MWLIYNRFGPLVGASSMYLVIFSFLFVAGDSGGVDGNNTGTRVGAGYINGGAGSRSGVSSVSVGSYSVVTSNRFVSDSLESWFFSSICLFLFFVVCIFVVCCVGTFSVICYVESSVSGEGFDFCSLLLILWGGISLYLAFYIYLVYLHVVPRGV